ncbi:MAG: DinB family protein [Chloroflexi bacterium]|nr:DinB family protein [Chloroflexota bacterium]
MELKDRLVQLLEQAHAVEEVFISQVSASEGREQGAPDGWSAKELVAHITVWKQVLVDRLHNPQHDPAAGVNHNDYQAHVFDSYPDKSWDAVQERAQQVFRSLLAAVKDLSDDELNDSHYFQWGSRRPVWRHVVQPGFNHPNTHIAEFEHRRGNVQQAMLLQEANAEGLRWLCDEPDWCGIAVYNLACYYATTEQVDRALRRLREALTLNPSLKQWASQDPDLLPLQYEPAFRSLLV